METASDTDQQTYVRKWKSLLHCAGLLISPQLDLLPYVFCLMVRMFCLMLALLHIYSTNIPPIMIINRIYEYQNILSL